MIRPLIAVAAFLLGACGPRYTDEQIAAATAEMRQLYQLRDYETGVVRGRDLARRAPRAFELRAWYAYHLARNSEVDSAVAHAEAMVRADSTSAWSWFALAAALNWHGERGKEALGASEKALALAPDDTTFVDLRAEVIRKQASDTAALAFLDSLPAAVASHPLLLVRRGVSLRFLADRTKDPRQNDASYAAFARARAADSVNVEAWYLPGSYLSGRQKVTDALPLLERAARLTTAVGVHQTYWRALLARPDVEAQAKGEAVEAGIQSLLARRGPTANALRAVAAAYGDLKLDGRRREFEERLLSEHPYTQATEWMLADQWRDVGRELWEEKRRTGVLNQELRERYRELLAAFIDRPQHLHQGLLGEAYLDLFMLVKDDSSVRAEYVYELVQGTVRYDRLNPHIAYGAGALALADRRTHLADAERLARQGVEEARKKVDDRKARGLFETEGDYQRSLGYLTGIMYDALGWVYFKAGRIDIARDTLLYAHELDPNNILNLYHLGRLYEVAENPERAEEFYIKGVMAETMGDNPSDSALKAFYQKRHGSLEGFDAYLARAAEIDRERRRRKVLVERVAAPQLAAPFSLTSLRGPSAASRDLRGKIVVINFWGIWCGPCVAEMPEFQKFHERYRRDPDVVVLTIDHRDNPDDVRAWMTKHRYDFQVLWDDGYVNTVSVTGFPTTWFIDRQGRIAFIKTGWSESLEEEFGWRVEALRGRAPGG